MVDNTNGGTLVPINVSLQVTSATTGAIAPVVGTDSLPGTAVGINAGAYSVAEVVVPDGYDASYSAGCSGSVTVGQNPMPVCTVTNTSKPVTVTVTSSCKTIGAVRSRQLRSH